MIPVRMMQVAIDEVIDMIPVRHRFVPAARAVDLGGIVAGAGRGVPVGIRGAHFDDVLVHMIAVRMMQMPVVQIIDVPVVFDRRVAAAGAVLMVVVGMNFAVAHYGGGLKFPERPPGAAGRQAGIRNCPARRPQPSLISSAKF